MHTLICTGNSGIDSARVAAATACNAAQMGRKTVLTSIGPSHNIGPLLGVALSSETQKIAPNLDAWILDAASDMSRLFEEVRPRLMGSLAQLGGDELPLIMGVDYFLCAQRLSQADASGYDLAVVDAGSHDALLRVLSLPDSFRWFVRLVFGLDRGPGQSSHSQGRSLVPTSFLPYEWVSAVQDARVKFEQTRDESTRPPTTTMRYVVRPDVAGLQESRVAVPALHLHGLALDMLVVGPLLPADISDSRLQPVVEQQQQVAAQAEQIWSAHPVLRLPLSPQTGSVADMAALGQALYTGHQPGEVPDMLLPIIHGDGAEPFLAIHLPGALRETLSLTLSGDELIVRAGPYRRHVLLPPALRGKNNIRASREGDRLVVRLRTE